MARERSVAPSRWHIWLPAVAAVASAGMIFLAATATRAIEERRNLALDGRVLGVAHAVERDLRDQGLEASRSVLARELAAAGGEVVALTLTAPNGAEQAHAGTPTGAGHPREIELFVGRGRERRGGPGGPATRFERLGTGRGRGASGPPRLRGGGGGRMLLRIHLAASATRAPLASRLLLPLTVVFAAALFGLALFGARLLHRQQLEAHRAAARRRLEALGRAGAGLAHQLRTPLATIKGASQLMIEEANEKEDEATSDSRARLHGRLDTVLEQVERMQRMVGRLLDYARPPRPEPRTITVAGAVADLEAETDVPPDLRVRADPEHLREILEILADNARKASPADAPVEIAGELRGDQVVLFVRDRGPGPGDDAEHLFEPYVSGRADGTGLGLPIARTLAEANGGSVALLQRAGGGCDAVLVLPRGSDE